jgi:hypothetical protein
VHDGNAKAKEMKGLVQQQAHQSAAADAERQENEAHFAARVATSERECERLNALVDGQRAQIKELSAGHTELLAKLRDEQADKGKLVCNARARAHANM